MNESIEFKPSVKVFQDCEVETHLLLSSSLRFSHTFKLYETLFQEAERDARLIPYELDLIDDADRDTLHEILMALRENYNFKSILVSNPFKIAVIPYVDGLDADARKAGAVNAVEKYLNILTGINIDGIAFVKAMEHEKVELKGQRICFLGCGGVSSAIATTIAEKCSFIGLIDTNSERALKLKAQLLQCVPSNMVHIMNPFGSKNLADYDIIYNGTGLGKQTSFNSDLYANPLNNADTLPSRGVAIDAIYTPSKTSFLKQCEESGMRPVNGLSHMVACTTLHLERCGNLKLPFEHVLETQRRLFPSE